MFSLSLFESLPDVIREIEKERKKKQDKPLFFQGERFIDKECIDRKPAGNGKKEKKKKPCKPPKKIHTAHDRVLLSIWQEGTPVFQWEN